jgi:YegS/Rv2252/BmrU family lipid kinase
MNVLVVVNPVSGSHGGDPTRLASLTGRALTTLASLGVRATLRPTERPGHATELAAAAAASGVDRVLAWGGDGTINEVATALAFGPTALAIVPAGSGNGLARELRVPLDPMRAIRTAVSGVVREIDVGELSGRSFLNVAGIGVDGRIARVFNAERSGRHGLLDYARIALRAFREYAPSSCTLTVDGEVLRAQPLLIAIANSAQYGNGARIAPLAVIDDGWLDVVVVDATSPWRDLLRARRLFTGTMARDARTIVRRGRVVRFEAAGETCAHVDGQPFVLRDRAEATVHARALRVVVPAPPGS